MYDPAVPLLGFYPSSLKIHVHINFIHNSQNMETTQMPFNSPFIAPKCGTSLQWNTALQ